MATRIGFTVAFAVLAAGAASCAQDKYTLEVPNGLAFSEFRGYEGWQTVSISHNGALMAVILGGEERSCHWAEVRPEKPTNLFRCSSHKRKPSVLRLPSNVTGLMVLKKGSASWQRSR